MARIQELLQGRDDRIDYQDIVKRYSWIVQPNQRCVLSPDSDGLLCGLFMSHMLNWQVKGFYDGKIMVLENGISAAECVFLDMEVYRNHIKSVGHHMVLYNANDIPENWVNFDNCIQANNMRGYDCLHTFRLKYPLATIHTLIGIVSSQIKVEIPESGIFPLLFTDGTYQVLFTYPENVLNWLNYLRADDIQNPLRIVFENEKFSVFRLMQAMDEFFRERDEISLPKQRGDRLRISNTDGSPCNIEKTNATYAINRDAYQRIEKFIELLSRLTQWPYDRAKWSWNNWNLYRFTKKILSPLNTRKYSRIIGQLPLSWAITTGQRLEYTIENPDTID
jgi:hypothetical protein